MGKKLKLLKTLKSGIIKRIHVNMHNIRHNLKKGEDLPVITVKNSKGNFYGHGVDIKDTNDDVVASIVYSDKPLSCGARVWIETTCKVEVHTR